MRLKIFENSKKINFFFSKARKCSSQGQFFEFNFDLKNSSSLSFPLSFSEILTGEKSEKEKEKEMKKKIFFGNKQKMYFMRCNSSDMLCDILWTCPHESKQKFVWKIFRNFGFFFNF